MSDSSSSSNNNSSSGIRSTPEIQSLLTQLANIQNDKENMARKVEELNKELSSLKEGKREEMRKVFDNVINRWLQESVKDEGVRKQFTDGMERYIDRTQDNGVWTVAVEASNLHARQIEELERLRQENESLRTGNAGGQFKDEASRKRGRDDGNGAAGGKGSDFWAGFELA